MSPFADGTPQTSQVSFEGPFKNWSLIPLPVANRATKLL